MLSAKLSGRPEEAATTVAPERFRLYDHRQPDGRSGVLSRVDAWIHKQQRGRDGAPSSKDEKRASGWRALLFDVAVGKPPASS
jgi:hypothetical protein